MLGMKNSKYASPLASLLRKPLFKANEARMLGIPARMLSHYCQRGMIERISRGLYRVLDVPTCVSLDLEELVMTALSVPHGIICLVSALCYYRLTDQIMREYWIAVPNKDRGPKRPHIRVVRMRNITLGRTSVRIGQYSVRIFDKERTIIDAFRYLSHEVAIKALQMYLKGVGGTKPDLQKLSHYATLLKVRIGPYILALTT